MHYTLEMSDCKTVNTSRTGQQTLKNTWCHLVISRNLGRLHEDVRNVFSCCR